jgi:LPXTG-site transpeptidase (sortase) family protein
MALVTLDPADEEARLDHARDWLSDGAPELSSQTLLSKGQRITAAVVLVALVVGVVLSAKDVGIAFVGLATASYAAIVANRVAMTLRSLRHPNLVVVSDEDARAVPDDELPVYTVLVPIYREAEVVPQLMANLRALDYPRHRLDLKILVEHDDEATLAAVLAYAGSEFDVVVVPDDAPRTKPKALNYGLTLARGEVVTIYDAEDRPDPLQLRKAAVAFRRLPASVGCLQARLDYWNSEQNLITRWFGTEYLQWFQLFLPGLAGGDAPVPLGGTSNHVRRSLLEAVGAWDPYNVTEDADLGIRLHRSGYRCAVLDSATWEEANSDYVNWNKQRSRWYKGYLQTWLVHMRHPSVLLDELGWRGWLEFNAFVGGTPVLALVNLVFWSLTILWFAGHFAFIQALFPTLLYYPALICFVVGNVAMVYLYVISARLSERDSLVWAACLVPVYWLMMGIAALKAFWQLFVARSFWEKTVHGLATDEHRPGALGPAMAPSPGGRAPWPDTPAPAFASVGSPALAATVAGEIERAHRSTPRWLAGLGRLLRDVGLALLVFVLYVFVLSGVHVSSPAASEAVPASRHPADGAVVAGLAIPRLGIDQPVVEGTTPTELQRGVGHLRGTALPGDTGNAVIVGHRVVDGRPLSKLAEVRVGDAVVVSTGGGQAIYRVRVASVQLADQVDLASTSGSWLTVVTGTGGLQTGNVLVVRAELMSEHGVRFVGARRPLSASPRLPGADLGALVLALLWLAAAFVALRGGRLIDRHWGRSWAVGLMGPLVVLAAFEMCLVGTNALPVTF